MTVGRNREFDKDEALEVAMNIFWKNGYNNTSLTDLTHAMGINKPSLYSAFGNKEQLLILALEQYQNQHIVPTFQHLIAPDYLLEQRISNYLKSLFTLFYQPYFPVGCLAVNSTCELAGDGMPEIAREFLSQVNQATKEKLTDFFAQEQSKGSISNNREPLSLALYLMSFNIGLAVLIRNKTPIEELETMIEHVVQSICMP